MEVAPDMKTALKIWWALTWRALLLTILVGFASGFILAVIFKIAGVAEEDAKDIIALINLPLGIYLGVKVLHRMMTHGFGRYRLVIKLREAA